MAVFPHPHRPISSANGSPALIGCARPVSEAIWPVSRPGNRIAALRLAPCCAVRLWLCGGNLDHCTITHFSGKRANQAFPRSLVIFPGTIRNEVVPGFSIVALSNRTGDQTLLHSDVLYSDCIGPRRATT